ncbi:MAG: AbrB/MazE/SpoVT family DNA-binding domain-containing protein [Actinomycetota bacterium]
MKSTGVVRKIDELGRIVLPSEIRKVLAIREGDELDISVNGEQVVLEKRRDLCSFCGAEGPEIELKGRRICHVCAVELRKHAPTEIRLPNEESVG